jgi:hypothetical protein
MTLRHSLRGEEGIKAFPLAGEEPALSATEGLDRGESLLHMPPFAFSVAERKIMNHFVVECLLQSSFTNLASCSRKIPIEEASLRLTGFGGREKK